MRSARLAIACLLLSGCEGPQRVFDPQGPAASALAELSWTLILGTTLPAVLTLVLVLLAIRRGRAREVAVAPSEAEEKVLLLGGLLVALILVGLLVASFRLGAIVRPPREPTVTIEVTGHQFWWEVRYPDLGIVTANELHIPVGQPVKILLTSADVIHSFWVPQLHGKQDLIPGHVNTHWIQADRPGAYRGQCAEFCGVQHALMAFWVYAEAPTDFEAWGEKMRARSAADEGGEAAIARGRRVFASASCSACHVVENDFPRAPMGSVGPNLTHYASRRMIAAATLPNTVETTRAFILDPHRYKPGVRMPQSKLAEEDLDALIAYLFSLR